MTRAGAAGLEEIVDVIATAIEDHTDLEIRLEPEEDLRTGGMFFDVFSADGNLELTVVVFDPRT